MGSPTHKSPHFDAMPLPTPEHQQKITRQKWFEIILVVALIIGGAGYLSWRDVRQRFHTDPAITLAKSADAVVNSGAKSDAVVNSGAKSDAATNIKGRKCLSFAKKLDAFDCHIDLIGEGESSPLETAIIWLTPVSVTAAPTPQTLQSAVNSVGVLAQKLVATSTDALDKASNTMVYVGDTKRPHDKGVAGTSDGWKLTYITYREFAETAPPETMLCLVLQRLSAASDPTLADFNRLLYEALHRGDFVKTTLAANP